MHACFFFEIRSILRYAVVNILTCYKLTGPNGRLELTNWATSLNKEFTYLLKIFDNLINDTR